MDTLAWYKELHAQGKTIVECSEIMKVSSYSIRLIRKKLGLLVKQPNKSRDTIPPFDIEPHLNLINIWKGAKHYPVVCLIPKRYEEMVSYE